MALSNPIGKIRFFAAVFLGAFWFSLFLVPIGVLLMNALESGSQVGLQITDPAVLGVMRLTVFQAAVSAILASLLGVGLGYGLRGSHWVEALLAIPYGVPTVAASAAWIVWLGKSDWLYSIKAVILAHVVFNIPLVALWVVRARSRVPQYQLEAAETLGASRFQKWIWVEWPHVRLPWLVATLQAFSLCAMSFALVLLLGGGPPVETLETAIYYRIRMGGLDLGGAVACAFWQLLMVTLPWSIASYLAFKSKPLLAGSLVGRNRRSSDKKNYLSLFLVLVLVLPYFAVFRLETPWQSWMHGTPGLWNSLVVSLKLAFFASVGSVIVAIAALLTQRNWMPVAMAIPSGVSALVLGLAVWVTYRQWVDPFDGSFLVLGLIQIMIFAPLAYRLLWPESLKSQSRLWEEARVLGANFWQAFCAIEFPRWRKPIFLAFFMTAAASLGEVAAVSLFYNEKLFPLPLLATRLMGQYRFDEAQGVVAVILVLSMSLISCVAHRSMYE